MRNENLKLEDLKCWVKRGKGIAKERDEAKRSGAGTLIVSDFL